MRVPQKELFLVCAQMLVESFFIFFAQKMLKNQILTSVWSAQHPNAGQNIQHL